MGSSSSVSVVWDQLALARQKEKDDLAMSKPKIQESNWGGGLKRNSVKEVQPFSEMQIRELEQLIHEKEQLKRQAPIISGPFDVKESPTVLPAKLLKANKPMKEDTLNKGSDRYRFSSRIYNPNPLIIQNDIESPMNLLLAKR
jgi:hypothetical protein